MTVGERFAALNAKPVIPVYATSCVSHRDSGVCWYDVREKRIHMLVKFDLFTGALIP